MPQQPRVPRSSGAAWAPLRNRTFGAMWSAQFISNIGGWMQVVGAQWLMLSLTRSTTLIALISTAAAVPVLLFSIPAGVISDLVDRKRYLLLAQTSMLIAAAALGVLALAELVTPWLLLALVFALGTGQAFTSPTWQTLQPELVPPRERQQAISLGAVNMNLARAVGPAIGGVLIVATSVGAVFMINAATFIVVIVVIARWQETRATGVLPREHVGEATRAGARYVAASPALRAVLVRTAVFAVFASAIWALLPVIANSQLHVGSGGYGLLLGCVGLGAVSGGVLLPRLREMLTPAALVASGSFGLAGVTLVLAYATTFALDAIALVIAGIAWILVLSVLNSAYQLLLPGWVKARGMAFYLIAFQGGMALGSAALGVAAQQLGLSTALLVAAVGLALGPLAGARYPFRKISPDDLVPAGDWPQPDVAPDESRGGPIMVSVEYWPRPGLEDDLILALEDARLSRRRTGASSWRVWRDAEQSGRILEQFVVASWTEHLRQHERVTKRDQERLNRIRAMTDPNRPTTVSHWLTPRPRSRT
jgi:predicted MFS family arabinose efflux permease